MSKLKIEELIKEIVIDILDIDDPNSYTEFEYQKMAFDLDLEDRLFSTFSLRSERTR